MDRAGRDIIRKGSSVVSAMPTMDVIFEPIDFQLFNYLHLRVQNEIVPGMGVVHRLPVRDVMEYLRIDRVSKLKDSLERLGKGSCSIDYRDFEDGTPRTILGHFLSSDVSSTASGMLFFAFDPIIVQFLHDPKVYAMISVSRFRDLKTFAAQRLYENMSLKSRMHAPVWEVTVDELRQIFQTGDKYARFDNFRTNVIERAVAEVNAIADFDVLVEYVKGGRGGGVVSIKFKPVTKSHSRLIEAAATKSAVARRKKSPDRHTVDMLDGQTWEERGGPAEVSLDAVEEARRLLPEGMEVNALLSEWREVNRGRALREPDMLFLNWVRARIEQEGDPLLKDIDADVFGALLSGRE